MLVSLVRAGLQARALSRTKVIKKRRVTTIMVAPKKESAASFLRRMQRASSSETVLEAVKADSSYGQRRSTRRL